MGRFDSTHDVRHSTLVTSGAEKDAGSDPTKRAQMGAVVAAVGAVLNETARELHPSCFALVMATGIVSIAAHLFGMSQIAISFFWLNIVAFAVLWLLTLSRLIHFPVRLVSDLFDHQKGPAFFTTVAGTGVLGSQFILVAGNYQAGMLLWLLSLCLWLGLVYAIFVGLTIKETKPSIAEGINGAWLLAIVATQSIANLSGLLASHLEQYQQEVLFFALAMWLFGGMLYIWIISLIFYRYTFFKFSPADLTPPYWINMGAVAITTLGGTVLIANAGQSPFLQELLPFLKGFTLFFWATGTWWIPMLLILGIWRHVFKRFPLAYSPLYWGAVFPLGMYTVCTYRLAEVIPIPFLIPFTQVFVFVALTAWAAVFTGLLRAMGRKLVIIVSAGRQAANRRSGLPKVASGHARPPVSGMASRGT